MGIEIGQFGSGDTSFNAHSIAARSDTGQPHFDPAARHDSRTRDILKNIVQMAQILDIKAIAMGVGSGIDAHIVTDIGFDCMQGNHIVEPVHIDGLEQFLTSRISYQKQIEKVASA